MTWLASSCREIDIDYELLISEAVHAGRFTKGSFTYDHMLSFPIDLYLKWHEVMVKAVNDANEAAKNKGGNDGE